MNKEARANINRDQINRFFFSYYSEWRHIQILSIAKKLDNKYEFYSDILDEIKNTDKSADDKTIAQAITNGLIFEAVQHSMQYIEDLFALIKAAQNFDFFIKNIIQYQAGKVESSIGRFSKELSNVAEKFHFPYFGLVKDHEEKDSQTVQVINESLERLGNVVSELQDYHKKHKFFYNQFKHGLSVALRAYGDYSDEWVEQDKCGEFNRPAIVAMDSVNFKSASKNQVGSEGLLMMPVFTEDVRLNIKKLQNENNLLRYVMAPPSTNIKNILDIAYKTKRCMHILVHNILEVINDKNPMKLRLLAEKNDEVYEFFINQA